jgi:hypothetical protein
VFSRCFPVNQLCRAALIVSVLCRAALIALGLCRSALIALVLSLGVNLLFLHVSFFLISLGLFALAIPNLFVNNIV